MSNGFLIIYALGAAQGVFLASILTSKWRRTVANRILAVTMLAFAADLAMAVYHAGGYHRFFPHLIGLDYPLALLYGPLIYLYVKVLGGHESFFQRRYWWHFAPFVLLTLFLMPFFLQDGTTKLALLGGQETSFWTRPLGVIAHAKIVHAFLYLVMTVATIRRFMRGASASHSPSEKFTLAWIRNLTFGILVLMVVSILMYILSLNESTSVIGMDPAVEYDDYTLLCLALFVYAIAFLGLRRPQVFDRVHDSSAELPTIAPKSVDEQSLDGPRYARSGLDTDAALRYKVELEKLMKSEHLYRRRDLSLQDLAAALAISQHHLTEVINTQFGMSFYDFVNGYRVEEVKRRLADPAYGHMTLLAIGLDAGFNSKSAFNSVFKKHTGMTPSQYRQRAAHLTEA